MSIAGAGHSDCMTTWARYASLGAASLMKEILGGHPPVPTAHGLRPRDPCCDRVDLTMHWGLPSDRAASSLTRLASLSAKAEVNQQSIAWPAHWPPHDPC